VSARKHPYKDWLDTQLILEDLKPVEPRALRKDVSLLDRQQAFGYTQEDTKLLMAPMATTGQEAVGSMGTDTPISAMSDKSKLLYTYFKQNFAQVTNPPIDPIREELVMSLVSFIGPRPNILDLVGTSRRKRLEVRQPILTNGDLEKIRSIGHTEESFDTKTIDVTYAATEGAAGMPGAHRAAVRARRGGRCRRLQHHHPVGPPGRAGPHRHPGAAGDGGRAPSSVRKGLRTSVGLVVESGEPREVHHFCCLAGYGAEAINPYLAFDTLLDMHKRGELPPEVDAYEVVSRYIKSIGKGILKVMSKMGISTYQSYCGAQIFDAVGLSTPFVDKYFTGTATTIEGVGLDEVAPKRSAAMSTRSATIRSCATRSMSAANTCTACAAKRISGRRMPSPPLQHAVRKNSRGTRSRNIRLNSTARRGRSRSAACSRSAGRRHRPQAGAARRGRAGRRYRQALLHRRDVFGSISREAHTTLASP
jgi:glutamate synthase (NADPH/NADH) large chain